MWAFRQKWKRFHRKGELLDFELLSTSFQIRQSQKISKTLFWSWVAGVIEISFKQLNIISTVPTFLLIFSHCVSHWSPRTRFCNSRMLTICVAYMIFFLIFWKSVAKHEVETCPAKVTHMSTCKNITNDWCLGASQWEVFPSPYLSGCRFCKTYCWKIRLFFEIWHKTDICEVCPSPNLTGCKFCPSHCCEIKLAFKNMTQDWYLWGLPLPKLDRV